MENITARKMAPSSIHLKRQLLLYRNNCKGRFACLQYASNNRCFSVASTDLRNECWHVVVLLSSA